MVRREPVALELLQAAQKYFDNADAKNTRQAYALDWRHFSAWCETNRVSALPATPETVGLYLSELARKYKFATIKRRLATISRVHQEMSFDSPTKNRKVKNTFKGIQNSIGSKQIGKKPLLAGDIKAMVQDLSGSLADARDKALLLVGYAGTFRRSELVGLNIEDLEFSADGVKITLCKSKTDQGGQGIVKAICRGANQDTCPVAALEAWLQAAGIVAGPVFRSFDIHKGLTGRRLCSKAVALIVKKYAANIGKDAKCFAGHSLRSGSVTQGAINGVADLALMRAGGWSNMVTVGRYVRDANIFRNNLSGSLGL